MANFYGDLAHQVESDGDSEISDIDPKQLAKMVEDIDDLDAGLFGSSAKMQGKQSTSKPAVKSALKNPSSDENVDKQRSRVTFDSPGRSLHKADSTQVKKKTVDFGDFDADDPLGDLLSDEDEAEDNFSNKKNKDDIFKSSIAENIGKQNLSSIPPDSQKKENKAKVIAELFGLGEEKKQPQQSQEDKSSTASWLGLKNPQPAEGKLREEIKPAAKTPEQVPEKVAPRMSLVQRRDGGGDDGEDLLSGMGFESERRDNKSSQSRSKLDEILGKTTYSKSDSAPPSMIDDLLGKSSSNRERSAAGDGRRNTPEKVESQQFSKNVSFGSYSPSVSNPGRRHSARRNSGGSALPDPLGIFTPTSSPTKEVSNRQSILGNPSNKPVDWLGISETPGHSSSATVVSSGLFDKQQRVSGRNQSLPDWLGGGESVAIDTTPPSPQTQAAVNTTVSSTPVSTTIPVQVEVPLQQPTVLNVGGTGGVGVLAAGSQMDQQIVAALQHQEMQLLTALHLKQHEERLSALQVRQQEMLQRQEKQLEELIRRQMERQEQLDLHMRTQQERINAHIQLLVAQPITNPVLPTAVASSMAGIPAGNTVNQKAELQAQEEQVQIEKKNIESVLESLQTKHLMEMQLLEDSYKRQIALLEDSSERQVERLRLENDRLEKEFQVRIARIEEEQSNLIEKQQLRLAALQKEHLEEMQHLREVHHQNLQEAHSQHSEMLEHMNKARALESEALKEASSYSRSLHVALDQLGRNSQELSGLQLELSSQHHSQLDTREAALQARETEIKVARENLEKQRAMSEEERKRLVSLVTQLEQKLVEQTQSSEEEKWNLRQEASRLDTATKAFEKERERALQQIDREKQQIQIMKESMLSEQHMLNEQLQQEKLSLTSEKSRLTTLAKLHGPTSPDVMKMRAELEAALKVAQDARVQAEAEHEKLRSQQHQLDKEKRRLEDFEHDVTSRAKELETLTKLAVAAREEGRRALEEARRMELQRSEHSADIQRQLTELREREKRLAQEKVFISEERLALKHEQSKVLCSYCRRPAGLPVMSPPPTPPDLHTRFVDPKVIIMRLSAEDEASRLEQESRFLSSYVSASK